MQSVLVLFNFCGKLYAFVTSSSKIFLSIDCVVNSNLHKSYCTFLSEHFLMSNNVYVILP